MTICGWCKSIVPLRISVYGLVQFKYDEHQLCQKCRNDLLSLTGQIKCGGCSRSQAQSDFCQDCLMWKSIYPEYRNNHHALFAYNGFARELIGRFKFEGDCEIAYLFKNDIKTYFRKKEKEVMIIPIPISSKSQSARGFNQTELLLEAADVSYHSLLENRYQTEKQSEKNREERLKTPQPFAIQERGIHLIKGNNIILADDIYTTGRTLLHAVEVIKRYGPASVESFSLFR